MLEAIKNSVAGSGQSSEMVNRPFGCTRGIVTNNNDPDNERRIKVTTAVCPGIDSNWIRRLKFFEGLDCPLPKVGATVLVIYEEQNPLIGFYIPLDNDTSKPDQKSSPQNDLHVNVPGIIRIDRDGGDIIVTFSGDTIDINANQDITGNTVIQGNTTQTGNVTLTGNMTINGNLTINGSLTLNGPGTLNGKNIATVGALDSDGDILITSGWS